MPGGRGVLLVTIDGGADRDERLSTRGLPTRRSRLYANLTMDGFVEIRKCVRRAGKRNAQLLLLLSHTIWSTGSSTLKLPPDHTGSDVFGHRTHHLIRPSFSAISRPHLHSPYVGSAPV